MSDVKRCSKCGVEKAPAEFSPKKGPGSGPRSYCKQCAAAARRAKRAANPEKMREEARLRYAADPERHRRHQRDYARRNPERCRSRWGAWFRANLEQYRERQRERYAAAPEVYRDRAHEYREAMTPDERTAYYRRSNQKKRQSGYDREHYRRNPLPHRERQGRRRARKLGTGPIEIVDAAQIIERDGAVCYLCQRNLSTSEVTLDHVIPLNRGGPHIAENLRVACRPCNSRKRDRTLDEFRQRFGYPA